MLAQIPGVLNFLLPPRILPKDGDFVTITFQASGQMDIVRQRK